MILALDIGGTRVKAGLVEEGHRVDQAVFPTPDRPQELVSSLRKRFEHRWREIRGVGVGMAGLVKNGRVVQAPNLPPAWWVSRSHLEDLFRLPVRMDNDVNVALLGEVTYGNGRGARSAVLITLGTGVGGAIWMDGQLVRGQGLAGEIGHMPLSPLSGPVCRCGNRGCVEAYLGGWAVEAWIRSNRTQQRIPEDLHTVEDLTRSNHPRVETFFRTYGTILGHTVVSVVHLLDVERVLVGGGIAHAWDRFSPYLLDTLEYALLSGEVRNLTVSRAKFVEEAGILGAAVLFESEGGSA